MVVLDETGPLTRLGAPKVSVALLFVTLAGDESVTRRSSMIAVIEPTPPAMPVPVTLWPMERPAVDATATPQGWRRPLMAWMELERCHLDAAGATEAAQTLARRLDVLQAKP